MQHIIKEACGFGVTVTQIKSDCAGYRFEVQGRTVAHMYRMPSGGWIGYSDNTRERGTRTKVADWCLDMAVNGG